MTRHPLQDPKIAVPLLAVLVLVNLPFLHVAFRGPREVTQAVPFSDNFERAELGNDYWSNGGNYRIVSGQLYAPGSGNNPLWLKARLPADVKVEFDVRSEGRDGDIKWEMFGDGRNHSTGYLFLFGWHHNVGSLLCKLDEHALTAGELKARLASVARPFPVQQSGLEALFESIRRPFVLAGARADLDKLEAGTYYKTETPFVVRRDDLRVLKSHVYHVVVTKKAGVIRWEMDGQLAIEMQDPAPLSGPGHDRFAFSTWANDTWFDNLKITAL